MTTKVEVIIKDFVTRREEMKASVLIFRFVFTLEEGHIIRFLLFISSLFFFRENCLHRSHALIGEKDFVCPFSSVIGFDFSASNLPPLNANICKKRRWNDNESLTCTELPVNLNLNFTMLFCG